MVAGLMKPTPVATFSEALESGCTPFPDPTVDSLKMASFVPAAMPESPDAEQKIMRLV